MPKRDQSLLEIETRFLVKNVRLNLKMVSEEVVVVM